MNAPFCYNKSIMKINITVPVRNEEKILLMSIPFLMEYVSARFEGHEWFVVIANNGSEDSTWEKIIKLQKQHNNLLTFNLAEPGRGGALLQSWRQFPADVLSYIDADLDIHPESLHRAFLKILQGYDLAIGSRVHPLSNVDQFLYRKVMSFFARGLVKTLFNAVYYDTQCGVKMMTAETLDKLRPYCIESGWFLDTELVLIADKLKCKITTVPVDHVANRLDFRRSKVSRYVDSWNFLRFLYHLKRRGL